MDKMDKIAIIGPSGAGKSTLAKELGHRLGLKVFHLDRFFWQPGWTRESSETRIEILENLVWEKSWVIEGTYLNSSEVHLQKADTIIFLDISPFVCLWRRIMRYFEYRGRPRRDIPKGSSDKLTLPGILKILFFPFEARRQLEDKLRKVASRKKVIRLHSVKEVERFLAQPEMYTNEIVEQSSSSVVTLPVLVLVIIAILTRGEWAVVVSLILTVLGFGWMAWQIDFFSPSKKEHQIVGQHF